ncbi:hypothetical protein ACTOB_006269 [Actinoplanes oblitus]|uniref:Uncharacterized protein n=1 Tax=Actinoplanes oblitus TaxID=3040509 RepID=A0ABY8W8Y1_9ACTN|nr:hypothetical protein [Actinoplanes oblitus]WIM94255.1 hypothetical protein ACTOB_006269 [Actinoplanes oblitus]
MSPFYLALAGLLLIIGLRYLKRALAPIGVIVEVVASAAVVAFALGAALALIVAAAFAG